MAAINRRNGLVLCLAFFFTATLGAEVPPLEREVNLTFKNEEVKTVLSRIEKQAQVFFSYNPSVITGFGPVTATYFKKSVREVLAAIFKEKISFNTRNNYIILKEKTAAQQAKKTKVSGYVYDESSGNKLSNVTIYDPATLRSATSDEYGYYEISVPAPTATLAVNKIAYRDTTLVTDTARTQPLTNIAINTVTAGSDTTEWNRRIQELNDATIALFRKLKSYAHTLNVRDSITRDWQVSFVPFVGTNHMMSGNVYNHLSFNVLGGYSRGNTGFEAGGLFNINRENMKGMQLAGLFNIVGDSVKGVQGAGLFNISEFSQGVQLAGLMNVSSVVRGVTGAGLMNITSGITGVTAAGLANISAHMDGFSVAGLFNVDGAGNAKQIAGLFNVAAETDLQIAGLVNAAHYVRGVQISTFNFADTASGVPIGFLTIVNKGVHQLELSGDEWFYANASFRTGVNSFYNVFSAGYMPASYPTKWQVGYGIGTSFRMSKSVRTDLNFSVHHVSTGEFATETSELFRFHPALEIRFARKLSVALGPTFNMYLISSAAADAGPDYVHDLPFNAYDNGLLSKQWVGGKLSLRFF